MANSATPGTAISCGVAGVNSITPVTVVLDTATSDLIVFSPAAGKHCALLGIVASEGLPLSLTIKQEATTLAVIELGLTSGEGSRLIERIGAPFIITPAGADLVFNTSVAFTGTLQVYVAESERFVIR